MSNQQKKPRVRSIARAGSHVLWLGAAFSDFAGDTPLDRRTVVLVIVKLIFLLAGAILTLTLGEDGQEDTKCLPPPSPLKGRKPKRPVQRRTKRVAPKRPKTCCARRRPGALRRRRARKTPNTTP